MKKNCIHWLKRHWLRRIFFAITIFSLLATGLDISPARAQDVGPQKYEIHANFHPVPREVCTKKDYEMTVYFMVFQVSGLAPLSPYAVTVSGRAEVGTLTPPTLPPFSLYVDQMGIADFKYHAPADRTEETLYFTISVPELGLKTDPPLELSFPVQRCKRNVRGNSNMGGPINKMMPTGAWNAVGTYDVVGTIEQQDDGNMKGKAVASAYLDAFFTGSEDEITCQHTTPWEGSGQVDLEADPNAWANEDMLVIKVAVQPMMVNTTQVTCKGPDDSGGSASSPPFTVASFDLNFEALPSAGGTTSLDFEFPNGQATFNMELIVTPEEAES